MIERDRILLTGFGPFPGVPVNASGEFAGALAAAANERFPAFDFVAEVLPTEWEAAPRRLAALLDETEPIIALHFGVSRSAEGYVIETMARNAAKAVEDACGASPANGCVIEKGSPCLPATFPAGEIVARLSRAGFPARTSDDAGGYLCNAVLYHSLCRAGAASPPIITGFVHIPVNLAESLDCPSRSPGALTSPSSSFPVIPAKAGRRREPRSVRHKGDLDRFSERVRRERNASSHCDPVWSGDLGSRLLPAFAGMTGNDGAQGTAPSEQAAPARSLGWREAVAGGLVIIEACLAPTNAAS